MHRYLENIPANFHPNPIWEKVKVKANIALLGGSPTSELRDFRCHMGSHSVTCHPTQVNAPHLTPARQAGTWFTNPGEMEVGVDLVDLIIPRPRPGVKLATFRSRVRNPTTVSVRLFWRWSLRQEKQDQQDEQWHEIISWSNKAAPMEQKI